MSADAWAAFDAENARVASGDSDAQSTPLRFAFYGRCSTEDNQDPKTSHEWQLRAATHLISRTGGEVVAEFFDIGLSRSIPWKRRPEAQRMLTELRNPARGWDAIVVGEGLRCWYGAQFDDVAALVGHRGLTLWIPELSGEYDPENASHYTLMTLTGGMSRGERQRTQARVRLSQAGQVQSAGRFQGGRPPYGYETEVVGNHPNPRKHAEGFRLKGLVPHPVAGPVVSEMFRLRLEGMTPPAIAGKLNERGVACPSALDPGRNQHRAQDGWQAGTVRTILKNHRYTGYEHWGKFEKQAVLVDEEDSTQGYVTKLKRADPSKLIRSIEASHKALVSVEDYWAVQKLWKENPTPQNRPAAAPSASVNRTRSLRGLLRCAYCGKAMQGGAGKRTVLYRCRAFKKTPGLVDEQHKHSIAVSEKRVVTEVNAWLSQVFSSNHLAETVDSLTAFAASDAEDTELVRVQSKILEMERKRTALHKLVVQLATAGADTEDMVRDIATTDQQLRALRTELVALENREPERGPEVGAMLTQLGDLATEVFAGADPGELWDFYLAVGLEIQYSHREGLAEVSIRPGGPSLPPIRTQMRL